MPAGRVRRNSRSFSCALSSLLKLIICFCLRGTDEVEAVSMSAIVGDAFEADAQRELSHLLGTVCPFSTHISAFSISRENPDLAQTYREIDLLAYLSGADAAGQPCQSIVVDGVTTVYPHGVDGVVEPARPALAWLEGERRFSDAEASGDMPQKYFIAEAYSGQSQRKRMEKFELLDTLLEHLFRRWQELHPTHAPADITEIVGAAALVFGAPAGKRTAVMRTVLSSLRDSLGSGRRPSVLRLARAGRLLLVILDTHQQMLTQQYRLLVKLLSTGKAYIKPEEVD